MSRKIYLASSWRNPQQPAVLAALRKAGHEVYDFRNPDSAGPQCDVGAGFGWRSIDPEWRGWTPKQFRRALNHPAAEAGFGADWRAMEWADTFVLLLPCGRSAHLEAGYAVGAGKPLAILLADGEPELMYKMADKLAIDVPEVCAWLDELGERRERPLDIRGIGAKLRRSAREGRGFHSVNRDEIDEIGEALEKCADTAYATAKPTWTAAILRKPDGSILVRKRGEGVMDAGMYGPPGGHVEKGELIPACLRRELLEETGLRATEFYLEQIYDEPRGVCYMFIVSKWDGAVQNEKGHGSWVWLHPDQLSDDRVQFGLADWLGRDEGDGERIETPCLAASSSVRMYHRQ